MSPKIHVIIHGHFYQPPRENPWTREIGSQESAAPFHDWNERITAECYTPNTRSRIQDDRGRLVQVVNNYQYMSYNFGPTLMSYLEAKHPETYRRILQADQHSFRQWGFGNAMAQAYNHVIMPLASQRDRWTQIQWGLADFQARFKRSPAGMWLPETAVNQDTLQDLVRAGIQFVLLSPSQSEAYRPLGSDHWREGPVPADRSYLCRTPAGDMNILFYQAGLSSAVAFEHLLRNAGIFADRIEQAGRQSDLPDDRLVLVCSDGESYGHHEKLGDMCLAYLTTQELPRRGMELTNPERFLASHPPAHEVRLKAGKDGEGTAWSCAHGVGRWKSDCGCADGGPVEWSQAWRTPLRQGFDALRQRLDPLFEREGAQLLKDPWQARDDYIKVILGKPVGAAQNFFQQHLLDPPPPEARSRVFRLMEMQRNGMLMYTSCGWFFADLAGLEPVQNMRYAVRAAELGKLVAGESIDGEMNQHLAHASSNQPGQGSGLDLVRRRVVPDTLSPGKVAAQYALLSLVEAEFEPERMYHFRIEAHRREKTSRSGFDASCCRLTVLSEGTREGGTLEAAVLCGSGLRIRAFVRPTSVENPPLDPATLLDTVEQEGFEAACQKWESEFGLGFGLQDMLIDVRIQVVHAMLGPLLAELSETYEQIFTRNESLLRTLEPMGIALPKALRFPVGWAGTSRFNELVDRALDDQEFDRAIVLYKWMEALDVPLNKQSASLLASRHLTDLMGNILDKPRPETMAVFVRLLKASQEIGLEIDEADLQVKMSSAMSQVLDELLDAARAGGPALDAARVFVGMAEEMRLNVDLAKERIRDAEL